VNTTDYLPEHGSVSDLAILTNRDHFTHQELRAITPKLAGELLRADIQPADKVDMLKKNSLF